YPCQRRPGWSPVTFSCDLRHARMYRECAYNCWSLKLLRRWLMADSYNGLPLPKDGARITYSNGKYTVPDNPIIPFIEGDGTGRDIWKASVRVFDAAVKKAYGSK